MSDRLPCWSVAGRILDIKGNPIGIGQKKTTISEEQTMNKSLIAENLNDKQFLSWIYDRLEKVHRENPESDYMKRLKGMFQECNLYEEWETDEEYRCQENGYTGCVTTILNKGMETTLFGTLIDPNGELLLAKWDEDGILLYLEGKVVCNSIRSKFSLQRKTIPVERQSICLKLFKNGKISQHSYKDVLSAHKGTLNSRSVAETIGVAEYKLDRVYSNDELNEMLVKNYVKAESDEMENEDV